MYSLDIDFKIQELESANKNTSLHPSSSDLESDEENTDDSSSNSDYIKPLPTNCLPEGCGYRKKNAGEKTRQSVNFSSD